MFLRKSRREREWLAVGSSSIKIQDATQPDRWKKTKNIPAGWVMRVNVKKINSYSSANASTRMDENLRSPHQEEELPEREIPWQQNFERLGENIKLATERKKWRQYANGVSFVMNLKSIDTFHTSLIPPFVPRGITLQFVSHFALSFVGTSHKERKS